MQSLIPIARSVAVFVSPTWTDQAAIRLWAKLVGAKMQTEIVVLTDEPSEANVVLQRQLRCSGIVCAIARMPTTLRSEAELLRARQKRDSMMASVVDAIWDFGGVFVGTSYDKPVTVVPLDPV